MENPTRVLFICEGNLHRSPTAALLYSTTPGVRTRSAGLSPHARVQVTEELLMWADLVFVMERRLAKQLQRRFGEVLQMKPVHDLQVPDDFQFQQPELVTVLKDKLESYLGLPAIVPEGNNSL